MTETEARQFMDRYFNAAFNEPIDVYLALLRPDVVLEDPVGTPPYRGREAVRELLLAGRAMIEQVDHEIRDVFACGGEIAARWSSRIRTKRGEQVVIDGIGVFSFDEGGKLRHVREFYDASHLRTIFSSGG
ncbi:nuclear transport factor 2 family protein [Sorangium sp. So ce124]|uniref:nuclear transport factor 2 family protein n=1 Tax=Sorangium sp. So ce124 TaxID=3133280 RepID=UPI003F613A02